MSQSTFLVMSGRSQSFMCLTSTEGSKGHNTVPHMGDRTQDLSVLKGVKDTTRCRMWGIEPRTSRFVVQRFTATPSRSPNFENNAAQQIFMYARTKTRRILIELVVAPCQTVLTK